MPIIAQRLKQLRAQRGLTQFAVAQGTGIAPTQYQAYEYEQKKPACENLIILADFFDVSIDYLVGRTENPNINT